ncbi:MAG: alanine dehydrogenase [Gammaproteobacteria bacterium]
MKIGVIKEIKDKENRVALTPSGAGTLVQAGHDVLVEHDAGTGSGFGNDEYTAAGAQIGTAAEAWDAELVIKVKEPLEQEYGFLKDNILFTYLHLAGVTPSLTEALLTAGTTAIAYETVEDRHGGLPLLAPMSAIAGNMAATVGAWYLARFNGGRGIQLGRILDERHGTVTIIGDGIVGRHAAFSADGMGANVIMLGKDSARFEHLQQIRPGGMRFVESGPDTIEEAVKNSDVVIGAVLLRGSRAPHLVTEAMVKRMQTGAVIVDVSIDQGGCVETSRPTSHSDPVFVKHDIIHYCVTNMPGAYPRTATIALDTATLPYVLKLADGGMPAVSGDPGFGKGVNTSRGRITCKPVAEALGMMGAYTPLMELT